MVDDSDSDGNGSVLPEPPEVNANLTSIAPQMDGYGSSGLPPEVMAKLPPQERSRLEVAVGMHAAASGTDQLLAKVPPAQAAAVIQTIISQAKSDNERDHNRRMAEIDARVRERDQRRQSHDARQFHNLILFMLVLVVATGLLVFFVIYGKDDLAKMLIPFFLGLGGGYGWGKSAKKDD